MFVNHTENVIEVSDVSFAYGDNTVLENASLAIHRGDYTAIVGKNGSGKTTLVKIILGLLKPSQGTVKIFGKPLDSFSDWSKIGYVQQKTLGIESQFPATISEVVMMGRHSRIGLFHTAKKDDKEKVREALEYVDMWVYRDKRIGELSGGQLQRTFIARALASEPEILFLDEPTVGVEKNIRDDFYALIQRLNKDLHLTIILITHDIESITSDTMHVACVEKSIVFHDSLADFLSGPHIERHTHAHII